MRSSSKEVSIILFSVCFTITLIGYICLQYELDKFFSTQKMASQSQSEPIPLDKIPQNLQSAVISIENPDSFPRKLAQNQISNSNNDKTLKNEIRIIIRAHQIKNNY